GVSYAAGGEEDGEASGFRGWRVVEAAPGDADHPVAGGEEVCVLVAVVIEGLFAVVVGTAVELE
ncbi:MAG: hypothetical protein ACR2ML_14580, partial [Solirubrobacteraceae bacterium]